MLITFSNNNANFFQNQQHAIGQLRPNQDNYNNTNQSNLTTLSPRIFYDRCSIENVGTTENVAFAVFISFIMVMSVLGNVMVLLASFMTKQLRSRSTICFIASLAVSDMMFAISSGPFAISMKFYQTFCHGVAACYWLLISDSMFNVASILNLFLIAIDRFVAIRMPFRYTFILPPKRAKILIVIVWLFSACWSFSGLFRWQTNDKNEIFSIRRTPKMRICTNENKDFYTASFLGIYLVPLLIMTATYLTILHIALKQIKAIEATQVDVQSIERTPDLPRKVTDDVERHRKAALRKRRKEIKATKSVAIVYFAFLICWFPSLVINLIIMYNDSYFPELRVTNPTLFLFIYYAFVQILPMINTMSNPLIYSFSNKQFKKAFKRLGYRFIGKRLAYPDSPRTQTQRPSRDENTSNGVCSPTTSCSSQSYQSINNPFPWSPEKINPKLSNLKGSYANTSIDSEMISTTSSSVAIWKPD